MNESRIRIGISSCLLGNPVRYDGGHKLNRGLLDAVGAFVEWVPVCPEVECGLPLPREAMQLVGPPRRPRLVSARTGVDHTAALESWAALRLEGLARDGIRGFVFKSGSPSCGLRALDIVHPQGGPPVRDGIGIFARAFICRFPAVPVEDEERLGDPRLREEFLGRLLAGPPCSPVAEG